MLVTGGLIIGKRGSKRMGKQKLKLSCFNTCSIIWIKEVYNGRRSQKACGCWCYIIQKRSIIWSCWEWGAKILPKSLPKTVPRQWQGWATGQSNFQNTERRVMSRYANWDNMQKSELQRWKIVQDRNSLQDVSQLLQKEREQSKQVTNLNKGLTLMEWVCITYWIPYVEPIWYLFFVNVVSLNQLDVQMRPPL